MMQVITYELLHPIIYKYIENMSEEKLEFYKLKSEHR